MRVLLDECLPRRLAREIQNHDVATVPEVGWAGKTNGELLGLINGQFDVFITIDQSLTYQQNIRDAEVAIVMLVAVNNRLETLRPLIPEILENLDMIHPGDIVRIGS